MTPTIITPQNITFALSIIAIIFAVYNSFKKPQIDGEKIAITMREDINSLQKQIIEIKETHLRSVEADIKTLTTAVNELSKTVVRLSTIIDERIPKGVK
jgi:uncharacterized membrane protein (DUF106 family)